MTWENGGTHPLTVELPPEWSRERVLKRAYTNKLRDEMGENEPEADDSSEGEQDQYDVEFFPGMGGYLEALSNEEHTAEVDDFTVLP